MTRRSLSRAASAQTVRWTSGSRTWWTCSSGSASRSAFRPAKRATGHPATPTRFRRSACTGSPGAAWHALAIALDHGLPVRSLAQVWSIGPVGPRDPEVWELRFHPDVRGGLVTPPIDDWVVECVAKEDTA